MKVSKRKISAVVPFFNERNTLNELVSQLDSYVDTIILVNDGSTDGWEKEFTHFEKIILLNHNNNIGKGAALLTGLKKSIELNSDFTVTIDADLQHEVSMLSNFIEAINDFDIVIGNRLHDISTMPIQRIMSNKITSWMLSKKLKLNIIDSQNGFRIFRTEILSLILPETLGFEAETEMIIKAGKNNLRIGFTEIPTIYSNSDSKMKPLQAIAGFLKVYFKY